MISNDDKSSFSLSLKFLEAANLVFLLDAEYRHIVKQCVDYLQQCFKINTNFVLFLKHIYLP